LITYSIIIIDLNEFRDEPIVRRLWILFNSGRQSRTPQGNPDCWPVKLSLQRPQLQRINPAINFVVSR
jgi:hypothetical protein